MAGYIGSKAVTLSTTAADVAGNAVIDGDLTVKGTTVTIDSAAVQEIRLGDNDKMTFGDATGGDLQIYHDGTSSYIQDAGTGDLRLRGSNIVIESNQSHDIFRGIEGGAATIYHNNAAKLATTSTGIDVTGTVTADGLTVDGGSVNNDSSAIAAKLNANGNEHIRLEISTDSTIGNQAALDLISNSNTSRIYTTGTSGLRFSTDGGSTNHVTIDGSGNVGIGRSPTAVGSYKMLELDGASGGYIRNYVNGTFTGYWYTGSGASGFGTQTSTPLTFDTNNTERMRIESNGRVAIGKTSATAMLDIDSTALTAVQVSTSQGYSLFNGSSAGAGARISIAAADASSGIVIAGYNDAQTGYTPLNYLAADHRYKIGSSEKARLDSSGNFVVGTTDDQPPTNNDASGIALRADGKVAASRSGGIAGDFNRGSAGDVMWFRENGSVFGTIGSASSGLVYFLAGKQNGIKIIGPTTGEDSLGPCDTNGGNRDNSMDLGWSSNRFDDVYATNGTIQTSDQNEKQQIAALTDAEITAARAISKLFKTFKWNDSVAEKGDAARTHTGVIAQEVEQAMTDAGLNAGDYAFFISTTWWETQTEVPAVEAAEAVEATYDEEGNVLTEAVEAVEAQEAYTRTDTYHTAEEAPEGATERNRKGIRYPQLLSFIGAATEQRLASIESRLDALEGN